MYTRQKPRDTIPILVLRRGSLSLLKKLNTNVSQSVAHMQEHFPQVIITVIQDYLVISYNVVSALIDYPHEVIYPELTLKLGPLLQFKQGKGAKIKFLVITDDTTFIWYEHLKNVWSWLLDEGNLRQATDVNLSRKNETQFEQAKKDLKHLLLIHKE
jgi:hypothetical protein